MNPPRCSSGGSKKRDCRRVRIPDRLQASRTHPDCRAWRLRGWRVRTCGDPGRGVAAVAGSRGRCRAPARPSQGLAAPGRGVFPPGSFARDRALSLRTHRRLDLPGSYDEFFAAAPRSTRESIKRYSNEGGGGAISARSSARASGRRPDIDEMFAATEHGGCQDLPARPRRRTHRADNDQARRLVTLGLERGWFRTWVLYVGRIRSRSGLAR